MEAWKEVECLEVSNQGRVRVDGKIVTCNVDGLGYKYIYTPTNKTTFDRVHRLVAMAFLEKPENRSRNTLEVNHKNGNKLDNRVENLEWVTKSENMKHAHRTGLSNMKGENSHWARLSAVAAMKIYLLANDERILSKDIAPVFDVQAKHIQRIKHKRRWGHIHEAEKRKELLSQIPDDYCDSFYETIDLSKRKGHKLTAGEAMEIYELAHNSGLTYREIGEQYGVTGGSVSNIKNKKTWSHIHE